MGGFGSVWLGEIFAVLAEVQEGVAVLAVKGDEVAADEFDAADVESVRWEGWIGGFGRTLGWAGDGLPGEGQVEVGIMGGVGVDGLDMFFLN
jgi:hypothetical protein